MPPKNMISVPRNHHMPSDAALRCCSSSAKWCRSSGRSACSVCSATEPSLKRHLFRKRHGLVFISFPGHDRCFLEIKGRRRRSGPPLQAGRAPWIVRRDLAVAQRPQEVRHGQQVSHGQKACTRGREHIQSLPLRHMRVIPVPPRHPQITENKLREKTQIKLKEDEG